PRDVVKAGDVIEVKVLEIDLKRRRVALTMCLGNNTNPPPPKRKRKPKKSTKPRKNTRKPSRKSNGELEKMVNKQQSSQMFAGSIMAEAFANARKG
ncbi:RNA-binding transcriptional accessory protein, partial [Thiotrichales bacterium HSG1]|nr:RNA-binding transcriptional accessory protein [Thiotrichales bacterium HSG1]